MADYSIRKAAKTDAEILAKLAVKMWTGHTVPELAMDFRSVLNTEDAACFLLYAQAQAVGFAQCQLRHDYVEGTSTSPVGYLEGIFVEPSVRHRHLAKQLLTACENWAREKGCTEFASDCALTNTDSIAFHQSVGFTEENRIVCFRKDL